MEKIGKSFIYRISWMMVCLLILVTMVLGIVWKYFNGVLERNVDEETRHLLSVYANSMEYSLNSTDMNLLTIVQQKNYLEELSNPDEARRYYASVHLLELLKWLRFNNDSVDMLLAGGNYENYVSDTGGRIKIKEQDEIINFMNRRRGERKEEGEVFSGTEGYIFQEVGGIKYLVRMYETEAYSVSAWVRTETLMDSMRKLENHSDRHLFLADRAGVCMESISGQEEALPGARQQNGRIWRQPVGEKGMQLVCYMEAADIYRQISLIPRIILCSIFGMIVLLLGLLGYMKAEIFMPIRELMRTISYIMEGDFQHRIEKKCKNKEFNMLNNAFNSMMDTIVQLRIQEYEKRIQLQEAELKYFQMLIRPHFFLNAMATIHSMSFENKGKEIRAFILALSKNIRYMFKAGLHTVPLKEEWEHLEHYFEMQEMLYPGCVFHFIEKKRELEDWEIPQMILHTFMENKYKHGFREGALLSIYVSVEKTELHGGEALQITIEDDGNPFPEEMVKKENRAALRKDGSGAGLFYIEKILEIMYGGDELLTIGNPEEGGSRIVLKIPPKTILQQK